MARLGAALLLAYRLARPGIRFPVARGRLGRVVRRRASGRVFQPLVLGPQLLDRFGQLPDLLHQHENHRDQFVARQVPQLIWRRQGHEVGYNTGSLKKW